MGTATGSTTRRPSPALTTSQGAGVSATRPWEATRRRITGRWSTAVGTTATAAVRSTGQATAAGTTEGVGARSTATTLLRP